MDQLKRKLSFRKKKNHVPECSKPHQWQEDEKKVRDSSCSFQVRYMGCMEVFESRGMKVCEDAIKALKAQCKGKYQRAILYVSGDALRVVDEISKSMIVDQTIEKVSFCAPDRNHEKGFAYICRDGTARRWMCHSFLALKESGERLSHAVGCAFAICLEKKQKREKESMTGVTVTYNPQQTSFTRTGSFRQKSLTERISDPQTALVAEPIPAAKLDNPYAVQRPHATNNMLERQGSFRVFQKLQESSSPFKRTLSLRLSELPSTLQRQNAILESPMENQENNPGSDSKESISDMCQQVTKGLGDLSSNDPFSNAPTRRSTQMMRSSSAVTRPPPTDQSHHSPAARIHSVATGHPFSRSPALQPLPVIQPIKQSNPWASDSSSSTSDWTTVSSASYGNPFSPVSSSVQNNGSPSVSNFANFGPMSQTTQVVHRPSLPHFRSHSLDTGAQKGPSLSELAKGKHQFHCNGDMQNVFQTQPATVQNGSGTTSDPFDVAWASSHTAVRNPFHKNEFPMNI